jgi:hypothetical protein
VVQSDNATEPYEDRRDRQPRLRCRLEPPQLPHGTRRPPEDKVDGQGHLGFGRLLALHYRSSTSYQIH